jgi:hypothetical protein
MPDWVIKRVDAIRECEGQGRTFWFLNQRKEPYEWTDEVLEDDTDFQGLLENEEEAVYPDVSAKLPGVELEAEERDFTPVSDELEVDFRELARQRSTTPESTRRSDCGLSKRQRAMRL